MVSENQKVYDAKYKKENQRQVLVKINRKTEPELLEWVEQHDNLQGYIKDLIRADMLAHRTSTDN